MTWWSAAHQDWWGQVTTTAVHILASACNSTLVSYLLVPSIYNPLGGSSQVQKGARKHATYPANSNIW
jgi:hypothetical protein